MKTETLLKHQKVIVDMVLALGDPAAPENPNRGKQMDALDFALDLINKELSKKLEAAGAVDVIQQYNNGLITLTELCYKLTEITLHTG